MIYFSLKYVLNIKSAFYPILIKRGYGAKYTFWHFQRHIRVLPDRVKRGYGVKYTFRLIKRHIRVLPDRVKHGYGVIYILFGSLKGISAAY
jgi:hypothetical protein